MPCFGYGFGVQSYINRIERTASDAPSRSRRRRYGGKRWDIHVRRTPARERFRHERLRRRRNLLYASAVVIAVVGAVLL